MASIRIVKNEMRKGISTYASYLEEDFFQDPENRERFIETLDVVYHSGHWVDEINEAAATSLAEGVLSESEAGWANNWLGISLGSGYIQDKLEYVEKELLTTAIVLGFAKMNIDVENDPEVVEDLFNRWIATDYDEDMFDVEKSIADNLHSAFKPLILSMFMPWILICVGVMLIPAIDLGLYGLISKRKEKSRSELKRRKCNHNKGYRAFLRVCKCLILNHLTFLLHQTNNLTHLCSPNGTQEL
jgi:hypothetical protein